VKDAKGDIAETSRLTRDSGLVFYSGDDKNTLPYLAVGAVGVVGVPTHLFGRQTKEMIFAFESGDHADALRRHQDLLPVYLGFFRTQGVILTKAALREQGLPAGPVRSPLVDATEAEVAQLRADCALAGLDLSGGRLASSPDAGAAR
jgi:4-hydroxy-tetrahydrodipicolinate synthase